MDRDKMKLNNDKHANNPEVGDFWHEMFAPICIVLDVKNKHVIICKDVIWEDDGGKWDFDKIKLMTKIEFKEWISYGSIEGYWCDIGESRYKDVERFNNE